MIKGLLNSIRVNFLKERNKNIRILVYRNDMKNCWNF